MKKPYIHSISIKYFIAAMLLIVLPICAFFLIARASNLNTSLEQKRTSDLNTLNTFSSNVTTYMESVQAIGSLAASDSNVQDFLLSSREQAYKEGKEFYKDMDNRSYLSSYTPVMDSILAISLMDPDFFFIGEQNLELNRLTYFFNATTQKEVTESEKEFYWTKTFSIEFTDTGSVYKVFSLLVPSLDDSGNLLGYVVVFVDTTFFNNLLLSYADKIYVIEGSYIIGYKKTLPANTNLFSEMQINYSLLLEDSSVIVQNPDDSLIITTRKFSPLDIQFLLVSSYRDLVDHLSTTYPPLTTFVVYGIVLAVLVAFVISKFQTKHIVLLKNVMNRMKEGDLSIRFHPRSKDEIAELGLTFNSLLDRIQELMEEQKQHQKIKRKMELQMIQEQIKPHFLYNVLEMINSVIRCNMTQEALATVESLASFYRISLSQGSDIISMSQEIQLLENYLSLQKKRYIEFMDYVLAFSPSISKYTIPKLTLQPLIENSIYHGIKEKDTKGTICVSGYIENGQVIIEVYDDGVGISPEKQKEIFQSIASEKSEPENHFGLASVVKRMNIHYNNQVTFRIDSEPGSYTCIILSFPAREYEDE